MLLSRSKAAAVQTVSLREDAPDPREAQRQLLRVSEVMNPGAADSFHAKFLIGRNSTGGNSLESIGRPLGYEGRLLENFMKGRN
jgi:hypothetical protein